MSDGGANSTRSNPTRRFRGKTAASTSSGPTCIVAQAGPGAGHDTGHDGWIEAITIER